MQELTAEVPIAEMGDFTTVLRSVTAGRGHYTLSFARYEQAPQPVADKVIADRAAETKNKQQSGNGFCRAAARIVPLFCRLVLKNRQIW